MASRCVLVVDDSKSARYAMRKYLEHLHCVVDAVESAKEAFDYLKLRQPDVVFLDNIMPEMTGLEMMPTLKSDPRTASIPIIFCTSIETEEFRAEARAAGALEVLKKPPSINQLAHLIAAIKPPARRAPVAPAPAAAPKPVAPTAPVTTVAPAASAANAEIMTQPAAIVPPAAAAAQAPSAPPASQLATIIDLLPSGENYAGLREQIDQRMRKLTDEVFVQLAELKQQVIHFDTSGLSSEEVNTFREIAREETENLHTAVQTELGAIRVRVDAIANLQEEEHQKMMQAARVAATSEAKSVAAQAVKDETHRIQERVVDSILKALGRGEPEK